jgi:hypothetical protein
VREVGVRVGVAGGGGGGRRKPKQRSTGPAHVGRRSRDEVQWAERRGRTAESMQSAGAAAS